MYTIRPIPGLGGAVKEKLQDLRPPLERILSVIQGRKEDTRVYTSGRSFFKYEFHLLVSARYNLK